MGDVLVEWFEGLGVAGGRPALEAQGVHETKCYKYKIRSMDICIHGIMQALERGGSLGLLLLRTSGRKRSGAWKWRAGTGKE